MKVFFTLVVILLFSLSAIPGFAGNKIQKSKTIVDTKTDSIGVTKLDSISNYSITINGKSIAVSITNNPSTQKKLDDNQKNPFNSIDIKGEGNSVTIQQNKNAGQVTIEQNGKGDQVTVSQTNSKK